MLRVRPVGLLLTSVLALAADSLVSGGEVPPRAASGQTLAIPRDMAELGEVYHILPDTVAQLTLTSDAAVRRAVIASQRVVGFLAAPFEPEEAPLPLLAGAARVPAASLRCGVDGLDAFLQSATAFDTANHAEVTLEFKDCRDARLESSADGRKVFALTVAAELKVKDKLLPLEFPARLTFVPFTWRTMRISLGDLLVLRGTVDAKTIALGLLPEGHTNFDTLAEELRLDLCLLASTVAPDTHLDPTFSAAEYHQQLQLLTLLRDFRDTEQGYAFGRKVVREYWDDGAALNRLAAAVLDLTEVELRDLAFVRGAAERANELVAARDPAVLYTLARLSRACGDLPAALEWIRQAAEHLDGAGPDVAGAIRATLKQYEAEGRASESGADGD